jgi:hypothetical protein
MGIDRGNQIPRKVGLRGAHTSKRERRKERKEEGMFFSGS